MNYQKIRRLKKKLGIKNVLDLIAMSSNNDPFYMTPGRVTKAKWFKKEVWDRFGYEGQTEIHIRDIHYVLVSQPEPVYWPNGSPYENTKNNSMYLEAASKDARHLKLVPNDAFIDKRSDPAIINYYSYEPDPYINISPSFYNEDAIAIPPFPSMPEYEIEDYDQCQHYHIEVWTEKSTMHKFLIPICEQYHVNIVTGLGELSLIHVNSLLDRIYENGKPCRILYVSDFDPAGEDMPVSVARKIEFELKHDNTLDVKLIPIILTKEQCKKLDLPRTPIKDKERRKANFEEKNGEGATELDALKTIKLGTYEEILIEAIKFYRDIELDSKVYLAQRELESELEEIFDDIMTEYTENIKKLKDEYTDLSKEFSGRFADLNNRTKTVWLNIRNTLQEQMPDIDDYPIPEPEVTCDDIEAVNISDNGENKEFSLETLYSSDRSYLEQIEFYKKHQKKECNIDFTKIIENVE